MEEQLFVNMMTMISGTTSDTSNMTWFIKQKGLPFENCLEVKKSNIHGNGVFANRDIPAGMVVTMYPEHGIIENGNIYVMEPYKQYYTDHVNIDDYKISMNDRYFIYGIPKLQDNYLVGHLINDSYPYVNETKYLEKQAFGKMLEKYFINTSARNNCVFVKQLGIVYIKTTKPIKAGQELLTYYGLGYWCKTLTQDEINEMTRQYIQSLTGKKQQFMFDLLFSLGEEGRPLPHANEVNKLLPLLKNKDIQEKLQHVLQK